MARSAWTGTISLGLMNMPAQLIQLGKDDASELITKQQALYEQERKRSSDSEQIGLRKFGGSQYFLSQACPATLPMPEPHLLSLVTAVPNEELNQVSFDEQYLIVPSGGAIHAFVLFMDTLAKHARVEIGTVEIRKRPALCAIAPEGGVLHLYTFQTAEDLRQVRGHLSSTLAHLLEKFARTTKATNQSRGLKKVG